MILGNHVSYYEIKITGKDIKRFLHNLHKMHIELYHITTDKNYAIIKVDEVGYQKILDIKTIYEIELVRVYGLAYFKQFIKKYYLFFSFLLIGFFLFFLFTNLIFEVEVVHNNKELRELILEELSQQGISKYHFVVSYSEKEKIKADILKKHKDTIEWLEIEREGVKYVVKVEERKLLDNEEASTYQHIVAKKNGVIKKITSSSGEIIAKKDQYVKAGDILISGILHNKEEEVARVKALGEVYAEVWYTVTVELPYHYHEEKILEERQKILEFQWFSKKWNWFRFQNYANSQKETVFQIKNFLLPFSVMIVEENKTEVIDKVYTKDNAYLEACEIAKKRLIEKLGENTEILYEKNLKITEENSKIEVVIFYKVYENIVATQEIAQTPEITGES